MSNEHFWNRLCKLVSPPSQPQHNMGDWGAVEKVLGIKLPEDYKQLIEHFGQGVFVGKAYVSGLLISSYLGPHPRDRALGAAEYLRTAVTPEYKFYPEIPGLLGFGSFGDKDTFAWNTVGHPSEWPIVWHDPYTGTHELPIGFLEFVVSILEETSSLHVDVIEHGPMTGPHTFIPES
jgi:hypothetical protein